MPKDSDRPKKQKRRRLPRLLMVAVFALAGGFGAVTLVDHFVDKSALTQIRQEVEHRFPELAGRARAQYGIFLWPAGGGDPVRVGGAGAPAVAPRMVVLVHGLDEPGALWADLGPALLAAGCHLGEMRYPNDGPVSASAALTAQHLAALRAAGAREVALVAHSMGGLVSREMLTSPEIDFPRRRAAGLVPAVPLLIQLGTPNHGSEMARFRGIVELRDHFSRILEGGSVPLGAIFDGVGEARIDLLPGSDFLRELNARPHPPGVVITIVAGVASPFERGRVEKALEPLEEHLPEAARPLLGDLAKTLEGAADGIGDGVVPLASTRLEGVPEPVQVKANHISMIRNALPGSKATPPAVPTVIERLREAGFVPADGVSGSP